MCDEMAIWNQPIDVSFAAVGLQGWPKIVLEIYETDSNNCVDLVGYGTCTLPLSPGLHQREVVVSRPRGSWTDDFQSSFLGGYPRYMHPDVITLGDSRFGHETISTGVAHLSVHVATKNLEDYVRLLPDSTQKGDTNTSVCHRCPARVNTERAEINFGI